MGREKSFGADVRGLSARVGLLLFVLVFMLVVGGGILLFVLL